MNEPSYEFKKIADKYTFEFESVSEEKIIKKIIEFSLLDANRSLYNVALVDILDNGSASDVAVTNNNDMPKVLATVYQAIEYFLNKHPTSRIYIEGSTKSRTRLYQIAIAKYKEELEPKFTILGLLNDDLQVFKEGINFDSFIITQKSWKLQKEKRRGK